MLQIRADARGLDHRSHGSDDDLSRTENEILRSPIGDASNISVGCGTPDAPSISVGCDASDAPSISASCDASSITWGPDDDASSHTTLRSIDGGGSAADEESVFSFQSRGLRAYHELASS